MCIGAPVYATPAKTAAQPDHGKSAGPDSLFTPRKQRELFSALDYKNPRFATALAPVAAAISRNDPIAARAALANHLRTRNQPPLALRTWHYQPAPAPATTPDPNIRYNAGEADAAAEGRVTGGLVKIEATFPGNRINWRHDETLRRARRGENVAHNPEWQWQLNRMWFWRPMDAAYRATGNEKYPRAWATQLRSFIEQCPVPERPDNNAGSTWRTIEAGTRMFDSWPNALHAFLLSPSLCDEDLLLFMHASLEHARFLARHPSGGNWLTMEMNGLYSTGVVFPEFAEAAAWRRQAITTLDGQLTRQFHPDGAQYELSPGYQAVALGSIVDMLRLAQHVRRADEFPPTYTANIEKACDFFLHLMTPDRDLPELNDSWPLSVPRLLRAASGLFPARQDYKWIITDGAEGAPPETGPTPSHYFEYAGYAVMRTDWSRAANYALFDAGTLGVGGHQHQDKLNILVWSYGREILFDNGGGSYEKSKWRSYSTDTFSHNTILVDGQPQRRAPRTRADASAPIDIQWQTTPQYDYAIGTYDDAYGDAHDGDGNNRPATHTRRVYFHKPDLFIIVDTLTPRTTAQPQKQNQNQPQSHTWQARWHLLTTRTQHDKRTSIVRTTDTGQPNLAIIPLHATTPLKVATASGQTTPEILGWDVRKDTIPQCVPATTVTHTMENATGPQMLVTLLHPLRAGAEPGKSLVESVEPVVSVFPSPPENRTIRVVLADGRRLTITLGSAPDSRLLVGVID
ncbi:MAG: heparinase II/III family protein [Opitutaceae bacterium]|jgi:hypothetical protein|nr:heparinase II/III family protein [Opitutaceae bacterium]